MLSLFSVASIFKETFYLRIKAFIVLSVNWIFLLITEI